MDCPCRSPYAIAKFDYALKDVVDSLILDKEGKRHHEYVMVSERSVSD
jgi:hypothetical protein